MYTATIEPLLTMGRLPLTEASKSMHAKASKSMSELWTRRQTFEIKAKAPTLSPKLQNRSRSFEIETSNPETSRWNRLLNPFRPLHERQSTNYCFGIGLKIPSRANGSGEASQPPLIRLNPLLRSLVVDGQVNASVRAASAEQESHPKKNTGFRPPEKKK